MTSTIEGFSPAGGAGELATDTSGQPPPLSLPKASSQPKTEDVAMVFTDIQGSAAATRRFGDLKMVRAKRAHFDQIDRLSEVWGGRRVAPPAGDSCLTVFSDTLAAAQFACDAQKHPGDRAIKIKAGVHRGLVFFLRDEVHGIQNIYGWNVDFAKRVQESLSEPGVILSSRIKDELDALFGANHQVVRLKLIEADMKGFGTWPVWRVGAGISAFLRLR